MRRFAVVLVEPAIQGNIGAVARAMMNFGVYDLRIVGDVPILEEAKQRAVHAQEILKSVRFFRDISDATSDLNLRVATTGIVQANEKRHLRSYLRLDEFSPKAFSFSGRIGLIFGRENYGLYNSELQICDIVVTIPTSPEYPIMNLSHAVSTVLYNLYLERENTGTAGRGNAPEGRNMRKVPSPQDMDRFIERVRLILERSGYPEHKRENTIIMIRRIVSRAFITAYEYNRLMGVLSRIEGAMRKREKK